MSAPVAFLDGRVTLHPGDCRETLKAIPDGSIDSVVTDPPYALVSIVKRFGSTGAAPAKGDVYARGAAGFMGKRWDTGETAFAVSFWAEVLRVLKPGGHVIAMAGTRTYHRLACAIEDAGFEIRDQLAWVYGTGFPKSHDVSKGIDRAAGVEREVIGQARTNKGDSGGRTYAALGEFAQSKFVDVTRPATSAAAAWEGWGTALKPAWEPIVLARKPLVGTVAETVMKHGTGALNIDGCRAGFDSAADETKTKSKNAHADFGSGPRENAVFGTDARPRGASGNYDPPGRWPANIVHDGSDEVLAAFPDSAGGKYPAACAGFGMSGGTRKQLGHSIEMGGEGSAARFFYSAKADADDRIGSKHPTVKPVDLMQWLCRLVTPPGGTVFDPFAGTGTTGEAAWRESFSAVLCEREPEYLDDIARRMTLAREGPTTRRLASAKARAAKGKASPLFDLLGPEAAE